MFQRWIELRFVPIAAPLALACATTPPPTLLENAKRVAIHTQGKSSVADLHARGRLESALRGAGSGTLEAIGACGQSGGNGDFAAFGVMLCLGLATIVGSLGGGILGASEGLPRDKVRDLNRDLETFLRDANLEHHFIALLSARTASQRFVSDLNPDLTLFVRLSEVRLQQHLARQLSLVLTASVKMQFAQSSAVGRTYARSYQFEGARQHVDVWLAGGGAGVARQVDDAFLGLANRIVSNLWSSTAQKPPPHKAMVIRQRVDKTAPAGPLPRFATTRTLHTGF